MPKARGASSLMRPLTVREAEVLSGLMLGFTYAKIAEVLGISVRTVEAHRLYLRQKTGAKTRAELVAWALNEDVGPLVRREEPKKKKKTRKRRS